MRCVFAALCLVALGLVGHSQTGNRPEKKPVRATEAETLKVAKDFRVELLLSVPAAQFGSWVNICFDPKGRLIVSDQYGLLYRVTVPPLGADLATATLKIEPLPASIGEAQGLLWAFDSLYVVVNGSKHKSGLYRVSSSKGDDNLDKVELLRVISGGGEHGPHAVIPHPDGKRLTILCGNQCRLVDCNTTRVPRLWGEDHLLPRMPDGQNFMADTLAPGGAIYNVSPDGKEWELYSTGYRNPFDLAYDHDGNLFTYDADMEWDFNTPWYRPTRVCEVTSGSEFGWRNGAGKYPAYYADNLPGIADIGPGSPTGICFGYGAKFPEKYQKALFICDWSYGKLYAIHMTPKGSVHTGEVEDFISGTPLPLTDVAVSPTDGAMYFTIGGRKTQSGLYRVTYTGKESVANIGQKSPASSIRQQLEAYHGKPDPKAIEFAWPHLGSEDRFVRFAARVVLEHQPVEQWREKALSEQNDQRLLTALLALTRVSATCPKHSKKNDATADPLKGDQILVRLNAQNLTNLTDEQRLEALRIYHILFNRFGRPVEHRRLETLKLLEPLLPSSNRFVDGELLQVLIYLDSPVAADRGVRALLAAPTQEEQIEYARALRVLRTGWTPELRKQYFEWMQKADGFRGGASFVGFLKQIRRDAAATLQPQELAALGTLVNPKVGPGAAPMAQRPVVKQYKLDDLVPLLDQAQSGRNFERGRAMFAEARCAACHRFDSEGGMGGPDLTQAAGRFSPKDLLESIIDPDKEISDQYAAVTIEVEDGRKFTGRIGNHNGEGLVLIPNMLEPGKTITINRGNIVSTKPSKVSMMPAGSLDTLKDEEVLDLLAYLLSRGDRKHKMFQK